MKKTVISLLFGILAQQVIAWENELTHPAITQEAVERSVLAGDYLQTQLGLNDKLDANLMLLEQYQNNLVRRAGQKRLIPMVWNTTELSIKEWLRTGSKFEDIPNPRARHHFYDPINDIGLNNMVVEPFSDIHGLIIYGSNALYPNYWAFDLLGGSAVKRALGRADDWGKDWESEPEYLVKYNWPTARDLFYYALVSEQKEERERILGSMFLVLGHICHLLEDQGVPAHTRNDFLWGHLVGHNYKKQTGVKDFWQVGGNPFEGWMEEQIKNNGDQIPSVYLARLMETPPAFNKFEDYWDTGVCVESGIPQWQGDNPGWPDTGFGNPPPEKSWGLAECTNYQFLSHSTIFRSWLAPGQHFPHPAKEHTRVDWYLTGHKGAKQYYRIGYDIPHLTRSTYTAYLLGDLAFWDTDTTEEKRVFEDYAKRTISRTVDYTTGLLNYFFRGKLSAEATCVDCNGFELTITNQSSNSGVQQTLKGGTFELYWDDANGGRTPVYDFVVNSWTSGSTLAYDASITGTFTKPEGEVAKYILVYKGNICANPADLDPDDQDIAIVTLTFDASSCDSVPGYMCVVWNDSAGTASGAGLTKDPANCCWVGTFVGGVKDGQDVVLTFHDGEWHGWYGSSSCGYTNDPVSGKTWSKSLSCEGGTVQLIDDITGTWEKIEYIPTADTNDCFGSMDCGYCEPTQTPKYIKLELSGVSFCDGCYEDGRYWKDYEPYSNINGSWILQQYTPCKWIGGPSHTTGYRLWLGSGCSSDEYWYGCFDPEYTFVQKVSPNLMLIHVHAAACSHTFEATDIPVISGCVDTDFANNDITGCNNVNAFAGGSAKITGLFYPPLVISGRVTQDGVGVENVTMIGLGANTDSDGFYSHLVERGWSGTVIPAKATECGPIGGGNDCVFTPVSRSYSNVTFDKENQDYTTAECVASPPEPVEWEVPPYETGSGWNAYTNMTAAEAFDESSPVEYYFECVSIPLISSGWTTNRVWNDVPIGREGQSLDFHFKVRDACGNTSNWSTSLPCE
jgi:hypothetical protein